MPAEVCVVPWLDVIHVPGSLAEFFGGECYHCGEVSFLPAVKVFMSCPTHDIRLLCLKCDAGVQPAGWLPVMEHPNPITQEWLDAERYDWLRANEISSPQESVASDLLSDPQQYILFPPRIPYKRRLRDWALRLLTFGLIAQMFTILFLLFVGLVF